MENLRLEHFQLPGFKLHPCSAINRRENARMKSEETTTVSKTPKFVSYEGKMNIFPIRLKTYFTMKLLCAAVDCYSCYLQHLLISAPIGSPQRGSRGRSFLSRVDLTSQ